MTVFQKTKMEFVDLGLSVKWATCNIGASSPEDCGTCMESVDLDVDFEARIPSRAEFLELMRECTWRFTVQNGVKGNLIVGANGNSIFLPASFDEGKQGRYWSSTPDENDAEHRAYCLDFHFIGARMEAESRSEKLCIRAVVL